MQQARPYAKCHPRVSFVPVMPRIVAIGDLHGARDALGAILRGTRLMDRNERWIGGRAHLVQVGDVFNRGTRAREAYELLLRLGTQARAAGGDVTVLLGNHDAMMACGNEAYSSAEEYLSFATGRERQRWARRRQKEFRALYRRDLGERYVLPLPARLDEWALHHVPGREALRRALGPGGRIGRAMRRQPLALQLGDSIFVHAGLNEQYAARGIDGCNDAARQTWRSLDARPSPAELRGSIFGDQQGPLWYRPYARSTDRRTGRSLNAVLCTLGAEG